MKNKKENKKRTMRKSTFDRVMADPDQKKKFEREYAQFLFSELVIDGMNEEHLSVRTLSKLSGVSTSIIQNMRSDYAKQ